jgi:hypothetical protein
MVVVALMIIVSVITVVNLSGRRSTSDLNNTTQQITAILREAQSRSVSGQSGATWGVYLANTTATAPFYALYKNVYSQANTVGYYRLPSDVQFATSSLPFGSSTSITFSPDSGLPSTSTSITIQLVPQGVFSTITINTPGLIAYSSTTTAPTGGGGVPGQPGTPSYGSIQSSTLTVNWGAASGATSYKLQRSADGNSFAQIAAPGGVSYPDSGLTPSTSYWYRVLGTNGSGDGPVSASSSVTTAALGDTTPPAPNPMTFASVPTASYGSFNRGKISMTATTASDTSTPPVNYLFTYSPSCAADNGTGGASSTWQASTAFSNDLLQTNQCYAYTVTAEDSAGTPNVGTSSAVFPVYTLADAFTIRLQINLSQPSVVKISSFRNNNNPANTQGAVQVTTADPNWNGDWVTATGASSSVAVWLNPWPSNLVIANANQPDTNYSFAAKARNGDNIETGMGAPTAGWTQANTPGTPTLSGATTSTITFANNANGNPSTTNYAVEVSSTDSNWNGDWVTATGASSSVAVWLTNAQAASIVVLNLQHNTTYTFAAEAKGGANLATALGPTASLTTTL